MGRWVQALLAVGLLTGGDYDKKGAAGVDAFQAFPAVRKLMDLTRAMVRTLCLTSWSHCWLMSNQIAAITTRLSIPSAEFPWWPGQHWTC